MKGMFSDFFTTQNSLVLKIQQSHQLLADNKIAPVDVPHKIIKLLTVYHKVLENDRAVLRKSLNRWLPFNPSEKQDLLDIEERFFKSDQKKIDDRINKMEVFNVATMAFPEAEHFYNYIKFRRETASYCQRVSSYLLKLKDELESADLKFSAIGIYEKGAVYRYCKDPAENLRLRLYEFKGNEIDESLLKFMEDTTKILAEGSEDNKTSGFYKKQLAKVEAMHFMRVAPNEERLFANAAGMT